MTTADKQKRGTSGNTSYTIFRTRNTVGDLAKVPEPTSIVGLTAFGAVTAGSVLKKRKAKNA
ncbi:PEP-CTERM sorting domain-containing protein [Calothrix sp. 336/3]|uniref:PEP-CTERM sorting domain-containing protein n=1 Tax=Calothrix sp. 336/3 TaxID=1337936 RepID=UPI0004E3376C|nr:PEP-CTERM sorting domain-containing protein [Calothrix sp. 336/3]AKG21503.1 hypothetical protein IJ00_09620 [Calothrix sp. 336/3]